MVKTLCLTMIVKDEINILKRCFDSIVDYLDYWVICDTGSTDNTQNFIKEYFREKNIKGELHQVPWVNFGHNRTEVFTKASIYMKDKQDVYYFVMDADDVFNGSLEEFKKDSTEHTSYNIDIKYVDLLFKRQQIFNAKYVWRYVGVLHEYPETCAKNITIGNINNCFINANTCGSRTTKVTRKEKYLNDAKILLDGIKDEPNNERYYFYLANSYYAAFEYEEASKYYKTRISMGGWNEEVYYSAYMYALCQMHLKNKLKLSTKHVLRNFLIAYKIRPTRLEALYEVVLYCRLNNKFELAYKLGKNAIKTCLKYPNDILFVNYPIHKYKFMDELAIVAYYVGNHTLAVELNDKIIRMYKEGEINIDIDRIKKNRNLSVKFY